jgi:hypothetical protein
VHCVAEDMCTGLNRLCSLGCRGFVYWLEADYMYTGCRKYVH